ncbi:urea transporter [Variovorax sp. J22P168]|uniref:urea transporter n=1 Tax=Variovorax jilinensis TaxID=3053513 RepID=UPI0025777D13|nr:urea transporter [Variovorax sp. J22P168]MDM0015550.1 urea transporter [Variovorax sp. J22P168]
MTLGKPLPDNLLTSCLRGAGQVFFQPNAATGLFFLAAIAWASHDNGNWSIFAGAVVGLVVATLTAHLIGCDAPSIHQGLYGFNGILVGVALPTFLSVNPTMWAYLVIGAAVSSVVVDALSTVVTRNWGIAGSTAPFVLVTWLLLLGAYAFAHLHIAGMGPPALATELAVGADTLSLRELPTILFLNIGEVFLLGSAISGVLIVIGLAVSSVPAAIAALLGSAVAIGCSIVLGVDTGAMREGLYGFSPVLTAIAVGVVFLKTSPKVVFFAFLATVFTVIVQGAMDTLMSPWGIPTLTAPYVLTMWLFTLPKKDINPHPHRTTKGGRLGG